MLHIVHQKKSLGGTLTNGAGIFLLELAFLPALLSPCSFGRKGRAPFCDTHD